VHFFSKSVTNVQKSNCIISSLKVREHVWDKWLNTVVCAFIRAAATGGGRAGSATGARRAQASHPTGSPMSACPLLPMPQETCFRPADARRRGELCAKSADASGALRE